MSEYTFTYGAGYSLGEEITTGGAVSREIARERVRELLDYYAQPDVRGSRAEPIGSVVTHCDECEANGVIIHRTDARLNKPLWACRTKTCPKCHGTGQLFCEIVTK